MLRSTVYMLPEDRPGTARTSRRKKRKCALTCSSCARASPVLVHTGPSSTLCTTVYASPSCDPARRYAVGPSDDRYPNTSDARDCNEYEHTDTGVPKSYCAHWGAPGVIGPERHCTPSVKALAGKEGGRQPGEDEEVPPRTMFVVPHIGRWHRCTRSAALTRETTRVWLSTTSAVSPPSSPRSGVAPTVMPAASSMLRSRGSVIRIEPFTGSGFATASETYSAPVAPA
mmetsp:Transcript_9616/g.23415  ORF Transcript_9616/g.23415 Transcript_9616/m.23415 type:complete len:228 (+) Transcript_9616:2827-3510(+)